MSIAVEHLPCLRDGLAGRRSSRSHGDHEGHEGFEDLWRTRRPFV